MSYLFFQILTKNYKFLQYLGWCEIYDQPKKFQKEACYIISNVAAYGGSIKVGFNIKEFTLLFESIWPLFMTDFFYA